MRSGNIIGLRQRIRRVKNTAAGRSHTSWRVASLRPLSDRNWRRSASIFFEPVKFAGGYAAIMAIILVSMCVMQFVQIPRPSAEERSRSGRPLLEIISQPKFVVALMSAMFGYAAMILMMTATPLAMQFCGHGFGDTAFVIQWHMVGMFAPSFFTGHIIKRFGVLNVITVGIILMFGSAAIGFSGIAVTQFWWALFLLGVGWNFMFIGGTTLVVESYRRKSVQKFRRFTISRSSPSLPSLVFRRGAIQHLWGWDWINTAMVIPMAVVLLATALLAFTTVARPLRVAAETTRFSSRSVRKFRVFPGQRAGIRAS